MSTSSQPTDGSPQLITARAPWGGAGGATLSTRQAAQMLGITERSVRRAIADGALAAERTGAAYCVRVADVERLAVQRAAARLPGVVAPAVATAGVVRPASPFIGRTPELANLRALLADPCERLITLTGAGGSGKTRLALEVAAQMPHHQWSGVRFVPLESVREPALVLPAIGQAIGVDERAGDSLLAQISLTLHAHRTLLILDNFEQVLPAARDVARLLEGVPELQILVTSRAPLRVVGERVFQVQPLRQAEGSATLAAVVASDAGRLFIDRAQRQVELPPLDDRAAQTIAEICRRVDGLPLGIELAAATTRMFSLGQLLERLDRRLPLLNDGPRDAPLRHAAMRSAIAWSYDLLAPAEQALFRRLAVCVGGFTLDALEALAPGDGSPLAALTALLDQSLVRRGEDRGGTRFTMLETIREFGLERLAAAGEAHQAHADHARYFAALLQSLLPVASVSGMRAPLERLAAEQGNLRATLTWLQAHGSDADFAGAVATLGLAWYPFHAIREGQQWVAAALVRAAEGDPLLRARLLVGCGGISFAQGQYDAIPALTAEAERCLAQVDAPLEWALAGTLRGAAQNASGNYSEAAGHLARARARAQAIPDPTLRAGMIGRILANQAVTARGQEQLQAASSIMEESLRHYAAGGFDLAEAQLLVTQGTVQHGLGDVPRALHCWRQALAALEPLGDPRLIADVFTLAASACADHGDHVPALLLAGAGEAMRERESTARSWRNDRREQAAFGRARRALGPARSAELFAAGRALSQAEAIALVGRLAQQATAVRPLSRRQQEVLRYLAAGLTDQAIADALFLSRRTVNWHVCAILRHLGAATRDDAVTRARSDGLLTG